MWWLASATIAKLRLPPWLTDTAPLGVIVPLAPAEAVMVYVLIANVAVTVLSPSMVTDTGLVVPVAAPLQPAKCQPAAGVAVSCTVLPWSSLAWSGLFATEPWPTVLTVRL